MTLVVWGSVKNGKRAENHRSSRINGKRRIQHVFKTGSNKSHKGYKIAN